MVKETRFLREIKGNGFKEGKGNGNGDVEDVDFRLELNKIFERRRKKILSAVICEHIFSGKFSLSRFDEILSRNFSLFFFV